MNIIWRVSSYLFRHKWLFYATLALAIGSTITGILIPLVVRDVLNNLSENSAVRDFWVGAGYVALLYLFTEILNSFRIRINNITEQRVLLDLRRDLHSKLLDLPVSFYDKRKSGEIASRVTEDVMNVERALLDGTEQGTSAILMIIGIISALFWMEPGLAWIVLVPLPIVIALAIWHSISTRKNWKKVREASGEMNALLVEDIQGNRLIHSFALGKRERERFNRISQELKKRTLKAMFRWSIHGPTVSFIEGLGMVAVVGFGGYFLATGSEFSVGDLVAFFFFVIMLNEPLSRMHGLNHLIAAAIPSGRRVFEILDHPVEVENPENPKNFPVKHCVEVRYENVDFAYPDREVVIKNLDLTLPAGKTTALVGHTGAGKSTIANLLLRYYDVTKGSVKIEGVDVRDLNLTELRSHIGFVAQDPFLFEGTVRDNLRLAHPGASEEQLIEALDAAHAWGFVQKLPDVLDTQIGEKGIRLSMGEKQRLTVARVLLKDPPIVVLDEATSSVDTLTERAIQDALETLMVNRTLLVIAHRLSTVRKADQIVVLDQGEILEQGTHDSLIAAGGRYAQLWSYQSDFISEESAMTSWERID